MRFEKVTEGTVSHLYTSPLGRARDTALYTEQLLGKEAVVEEWTRELSYWPRLPGTSRPGEGGLAMWDVSGEVVRSLDDLHNGNMFERVSDVTEAQHPYEKLQAHSDRFLARHGYAREGHRYRIVNKNRDIIAVFCHGGFGLTWMAHLLNIPLPMVWTSFYLPPSSVTTILFDERSADYATPRAIGIGDVGHLYAEGLVMPNSKYEKPNKYGDWKRPSGIKANFF